MTSAGTPSPRRRWPAYMRWGIGLALAFAAHAGAALALLANWHTDAEQIASAPAIIIDLAPMPVAPAPVPTVTAPGPAQAKAQPRAEPVEQKPVETPDLPPEPAPQAQVTLPPRKPIEQQPEREKATSPARKQISHESAPSHAQRRAARAAAPTPGARSHDPNAVPNWQSRLMAQLERHKRYPSEAQSRGEQGVVKLAFSVDRSGGVHHPRILQSSGSSLLDRATLALLARAAPLPPPPAEIHGAQITIAVPIRYSLR